MTSATQQDRFYFYSFVVMAVLCLGGFVPTYFLRPLFHAEPLPVWVHFHGLSYTLWYVVAILQAWLILKNKRLLHRELGVVAALIVISSFILTYVAVAYLVGTGQHVTGGAKFSLILTMAFTCCITVGIYCRKHPAVHRSLMLMGTALLTIPGFDRLLRIIIQPSIPDFSTPDAQKIVLSVGAVYVGYMVYRDIREYRRVTLGVPLGFACIVGGGVLGALFGDTETWSAMVASFGNGATAGEVTHH